jgi:hypothetical protein
MLEQRTQMFDPAGIADDVVVAAGLIVAGRLPAAAVRDHLTAAASTGESLGALAFAQDRVAPAEWTLFHQLWYRFKVPFGSASLSWWYLLCAALRQVADPAEATHRFQLWLGEVDGLPVEQRPAALARLTGIGDGDTVVLVRDEFTAAAGLLHAALRGAPLLVATAPTDFARLRAAQIDVVLGDRGESARTIVDACHGRPPRFSGLWPETLAAWEALPGEERTLVLTTVEQRLAALEQVRLTRGVDVLDNDGIIAVLAECRRREPSAWTPTQMVVATTAWLWNEAGFVLQELNQAQTTLPLLRVFLERRLAEYLKVTGGEAPIEPSLVDTARLLGRFRGIVERTHWRCLYFDGGNWERREFLQAKAELPAAGRVPAALRETWTQHTGVAFPDGDGPEALARFVDDALERGVTPTELILTLAEWAANTPDFPVDYAIFTVPWGVKLDRPWDLTIEEIFCYTAIRRDLDPGAYGVPLDHVGIQNAIGQRMRYNAIKKAQNYALVKHMKPQSFNLPDIAIAEDAHHGGHRASGIRHSCRIPMAIAYQGSRWKGIADVRLNRLDYAHDRGFLPSDMPRASRYAAWSTVIADAAYARGLLFDERFCRKVEPASPRPGATVGSPA